MTTEGAPKKTPETPSQTPPAGAPAEPTPTTPPAADPPPAAGTPATPSDSTNTPTTPTKPSPITLGDDDDDIPEGASLLQLSRNALNKRLDRATKKELRSKFGTDNYEEIKAKLDKAAEYERTQEEQRRAQLSEIDRANEDAARWKKKHDELHARVKTEKQTSLITSGQNQVVTIAKEFLDPDYLETELPIFARELTAKYSREEIDKLDDGAIRAYFQKRVETKPKLAKDYGGAPPAQAAPPADPPKPLTNGNKENERPTARTDGSGLPVNGEKDFRPNLPNSMSTQEARQAAAASGYRW